MLQFFMHHLL